MSASSWSWPDDAAHRAAAAPSRARLVPVWIVSLSSFTGFVLATRFGSGAMAICLGGWAVYAAAWPRRSLAWLDATRLPWLLPFYAATSTLWSIEPSISFKLGIEFTAFTAIAIVAAHAQSRRALLSSWMCALLVGVLLSAAFHTTAAVGTTGEVALIGIFGSKNNLASFCCLSMIASVAVLADRGQARALRALALPGLALDPVLLLKAHSLGALLAGGGAMAATLGVVLLQGIERRRRNLLLALLGILAFAAGVTALIALSQGFDVSSLLAAAGKDPSLTGRTFLWSRAREYIALRPVLGVGYQSFWVQGHVEAEALWRFAQIESRTGFHFHNLYYETAVELGLLGAAILGVTLVAVAFAAIRLALRRPAPDTAFLTGLVVFYAIRVGVELDFLDPFSPGSLLLPIAWIWCRSTVGLEPAGTRARAGGILAAGPHG